MGRTYAGNHASVCRWAPPESRLSANSKIATGTAGDKVNYVVFWDQLEKGELKKFGEDVHKGDICAMKFVPREGELNLVTGSSTGALHLYEVDQAGVSSVSSFDTHTDNVTSIDINQNTLEVASVSEDGRLVIQSLGANGGKQVFENADFSTLTGVAFATTSTCVTCSSGTYLKLWDCRMDAEGAGCQIETKDTSSGDMAFNCLAVHPSQSHSVVVGTSDGEVSIWDMRYPQGATSKTQAHSSDIWEVQFNQGNPSYFMTCSDDGTVLLWSDFPERPAQETISMISEEKSPISSFDFNINKSELVYVTDGEAICTKNMSDLLGGSSHMEL